MKFPTVILVSLIICSVVRPAPALFTKKPTAVAPNTTSQASSVEAAKKAVSPSLFQKTKALITGKPQPENKPAADIKGTKLMAVNSPDKKLFTVDGNKQLGAGAYGAVYDAKNHSSPNTPTVMKISKTPGSITMNPSLVTRNQGEPSKDFKNRVKANTAGAAAFDQAHAQATVNQENGFNRRMGLSAGKPVAVADGHQTMTAMPMKKVEGAPLYKELQKGRGDPSYISSHTLLHNAKNAIDDANNKGIQHNDAHSANIMVTKTGGKLIDYGYDFIMRFAD